MNVWSDRKKGEGQPEAHKGTCPYVPVIKVYDEGTGIMRILSMSDFFYYYFALFYDLFL